VLLFLGVLSLGWNFWPFLGIFGKVWKCVKCTISVYFGDHIWFYSEHLSQHCDFMLHHWCRRRGCRRTTKSFDLMKIRGNLGKISENFHKIPENLRKPWKYEQKWRTTAPKRTWRTFFWRSEFFLGQVRENSNKNLSHSQKYACYLLHYHRFRDFLLGLLF